ncbi:hypothetical protein AHF37_08913 [Paragonimus kellicotti]|nr:hypothetical protein AHF37_08913 [Paragonimus kellicotti]
MTSVRAAGYSSMGRRMSTALYRGGPDLGDTVDAAPPLEVKPEDSPEERIKVMEKGRLRDMMDLNELSCPF